MLLTAPDSVKIFIMFLLLQSLVSFCALVHYPKLSDGCLWPPFLQLKYFDGEIVRYLLSKNAKVTGRFSQTGKRSLTIAKHLGFRGN